MEVDTFDKYILFFFFYLCYLTHCDLVTELTKNEHIIKKQYLYFLQLFLKYCKSYE